MTKKYTINSIREYHSYIVVTLSNVQKAMCAYGYVLEACCLQYDEHDETKNKARVKEIDTIIDNIRSPDDTKSYSNEALHAALDKYTSLYDKLKGFTKYAVHLLNLENTAAMANEGITFLTSLVDFDDNLNNYKEN